MLRRTIGITAAAAAVTIASIAPAQAKGPSLTSYQASASATALELTLLGQDLAVSHTQAEISKASDTPTAAADGAAVILAGNAQPEGAKVTAPDGGSKNVCAVDVDLAALTSGAVSLANAALACVTTNASIADGAPSADSTTGEVVINILAPGGTALEPLLTPLFSNVTTVTNEVVTALDPIFQIVQTTTQVELDTVLQNILADLANQTVVLAQIAVAPSASLTSATDTAGVVARAGSNGVTIRILPGVSATLQNLGFNVPAVTEPLLEVQLGQAVAEVNRNAVSGAGSVPQAYAAQLLGIHAADSLGMIQEVTGQLTGAIDSLAANQLSCSGGALADIVCIDLGTVNELDSTELATRGLDFGPETRGVEASAANVQVLPIAADALGGSVLGVTLARATAAANALAPLPGSPTPPPVSRGDGPLASTGGETALPLTFALLAVGSAGAYLLRRTRTARA